MCSFRILDRGLGLVKVILPELAFISPSWIKERIFVDLVILHLLWTYLRKIELGAHRPGAHLSTQMHMQYRDSTKITHVM